MLLNRLLVSIQNKRKDGYTYSFEDNNKKARKMRDDESIRPQVSGSNMQQWNRPRNNNNLRRYGPLTISSKKRTSKGLVGLIVVELILHSSHETYSITIIVKLLTSAVTGGKRKRSENGRQIFGRRLYRALNTW